MQDSLLGDADVLGVDCGRGQRTEGPNYIYIYTHPVYTNFRTTAIGYYLLDMFMMYYILYIIYIIYKSHI